MSQQTYEPVQQKSTLEPIRYTNQSIENGPQLFVLNQLFLPHRMEYDEIKNTQDAWISIREMRVRGAPAIAMVAMLGLAVDLHQTWYKETTNKDITIQNIVNWLNEKMDHLATSRPTAVNLFLAIDQMKQFITNSQHTTCQSFILDVIKNAEQIIQQGINECESISRHGSQFIINLLKSTRGQDIRLLTHCNTGALATARYGTALGVVRFLHASNSLSHVYATETRPYNQGARLTSFELVFEKIPATLICDSAVSYLLSLNRVDAIVVGADRICANGDTANKIGTYQLAISAKHHGIPFFIAAPSTSIDLNLNNGSEIEIEERSPEELTHEMHSKSRVVVEGVNVWNPGFDVTPGRLITGGIITEHGVATPTKEGEYDLRKFLQA